MFRAFKIAAFLAYKSIIKSNRAVSGLMIFILSLAFINQIFIGAILKGMISMFERYVTINMVSNIIIDPQEEPTRKIYINNATDIQKQVERIPGVIATSRRYKLAGSIAYDKDKNGKVKYVSRELIGIDPEEDKKVSGIFKSIIAGEYLDGLKNGDILLGADLAGGYGGMGEFMGLNGAKVGEKITITYGNNFVREYTIKGVFKTGMDADVWAFITAKEAESLLSTYNTASQILVKIDKIGEESVYVDQIQSLAPNLRVRTWEDYAGIVNEFSQSLDIIASVVSAIGLAVVAITIFILIYVNVVNKRRQIGILKAIGIREDIIIWSYIFQALFYALLGTTFGLLLIFYAIAPLLIAYPLQLPFGNVSLTLDSTRIVLGVTSFFAAAFLAGLIPSWHGAKENILKAIWGA